MSNYVLSLDVGDRRIGLALASKIARLPAPFGVIDRQNSTEVFEDIKRIVNDQDVETVVVGLPRSMDGQESAQTLITRSFATELADNLQVPVVMQDESVTSIEAEARLKARGKPYGKGDIDAEAAAMILDDYLKTTTGRTG